MLDYMESVRLALAALIIASCAATPRSNEPVRRSAVTCDQPSLTETAIERMSVEELQHLLGRTSACAAQISSTSSAERKDIRLRALDRRQRLARRRLAELEHPTVNPADTDVRIEGRILYDNRCEHRPLELDCGR